MVVKGKIRWVSRKGGDGGGGAGIFLGGRGEVGVGTAGSIRNFVPRSPDDLLQSEGHILRICCTGCSLHGALLYRSRRVGCCTGQCTSATVPTVHSSKKIQISAI